MKKKIAAQVRKKTATAATVSAAPKPQAASSKPSMAIAIAALLINVFLIPGLGTIIGGKIRHGLVQLLLLWLGGIILAFFGFVLAVGSPVFGLVIAILGSLMVLTGWVWAIISSVFLVRKASA